MEYRCALPEDTCSQGSAAQQVTEPTPSSSHPPLLAPPTAAQVGERSRCHVELSRRVLSPRILRQTVNRFAMLFSVCKQKKKMLLSKINYLKNTGNPWCVFSSRYVGWSLEYPYFHFFRLSVCLFVMDSSGGQRSQPILMKLDR